MINTTTQLQLESGVYFIKIYNSDKQIVRKVVILK